MPGFDDTDRFIARWAESGASERANYQLFLTELCDLLGMPMPEPARSDDRQNAYAFERNVPLHHDDGKTTVGRIDLYKRGCFILEAKQGGASSLESPLFGTLMPVKGKAATARRGTSRWDDAMQRPKNQAERYARELPIALLPRGCGGSQGQEGKRTNSGGGETCGHLNEFGHALGRTEFRLRQGHLQEVDSVFFVVGYQDAESPGRRVLDLDREATAEGVGAAKEVGWRRGMTWKTQATWLRRLTRPVREQAPTYSQS